MQLKLDAFLRPPAPPPADEPEAVQPTGESSPPTRARSPSVADYALVAHCLPQVLESPAKFAAQPAPKAAKPPAKPPTKSAAKPAAQVAAKSLQPSLQLQSPFQWPLLSMCSSSKSNYRTTKSGTRSLSLGRAEHACQQAVSGSFCGSCALVFACFASCHGCGVFPCGGSVILAAFLRECGDTATRRRVLIKGRGGGVHTPKMPPGNVPYAPLAIPPPQGGNVIFTFPLERVGCTVLSCSSFASALCQSRFLLSFRHKCMP